MNTTENHWLIINEDLCLSSIADGPTWMMGNLLSLHYHYPATASRQCAPVDAYLLQIMPENITVSYEIDKCDVKLSVLCVLEFVEFGMMSADVVSL